MDRHQWSLLFEMLARLEDSGDITAEESAVLTDCVAADNQKMISLFLQNQQDEKNFIHSVRSSGLHRPGVNSDERPESLAKPHSARKTAQQEQEPAPPKRATMFNTPLPNLAGNTAQQEQEPEPPRRAAIATAVLPPQTQALPDEALHLGIFQHYESTVDSKPVRKEGPEATNVRNKVDASGFGQSLQSRASPSQHISPLPDLSDLQVDEAEASDIRSETDLANGTSHTSSPFAIAAANGAPLMSYQTVTGIPTLERRRLAGDAINVDISLLDGGQPTQATVEQRQVAIDAKAQVARAVNHVDSVEHKIDELRVGRAVEYVDRLTQ